MADMGDHHRIFEVTDYSLFRPSPNAEIVNRRLQRLDRIVHMLLAVLLGLCLWNIIRLVSLRRISSQDFADISNITNDISTRLIWIVASITVAIIAWREWKYVEPSAHLIYLGGAILLALLVPAMMSEVQTPIEEINLRIVMVECPESAIQHDRLPLLPVCDPRPIHAGDVMLATSDPRKGSFETLDPTSGGQNTIGYTIAGRGEYVVYFMFRFDDMAMCERTTIFYTYGPVSEGQLFDCMEYGGAAWKIIPHKAGITIPAGVQLAQLRSGE